MTTRLHVLCALAVSSVLLVCSACKSPNVMVSNTLGEDRTIQYITQRVEEGDAFDLYVRVCPLNAQGMQDEANCKKSLVMENVAIRTEAR